MQAAAGARVGTKVRITLEPDLEKRDVALPAELKRHLKSDRKLGKWFEQLSPSMRREIGKWVSEPKSVESRMKRADRMTERLIQAMEGELDPPPILKAAFQRQPLARAGWEALTAAQRCNHLLGIFYYETAEARERRTTKAVADALAKLRRLRKPRDRGADDESA